MKLSNEKRREIYRREGFRCAVCDSTRGMSIHHYISRARGGSNHEHNLVCLCNNCHMTIHGLKVAEMKYLNVTTEDIEQAVVEYLSDEYPMIWNPYNK